MKRMFKPFMVVALTILVMVTGTYAKRKKKDKEAEADSTVVAAEDSPALSQGFVLTTLEGTEVSSLDFLGKPVVLDFFGVACGPCRNVLLFTQKMADEYGNEAWIYAVDAWNDTPEQIQELWAELVLDLPVLVADASVLARFEVDAVPTYCVFDQKGELVEKLVGYNEDNEKALGKRLAKLVRKNGDVEEIATLPSEETLVESGEAGESQVTAAAGDAESDAETVLTEEEVAVEEEVFVEEEVAVTAVAEEAVEEEVTEVGVAGAPEVAATEPEAQPPVKVEIIINTYPSPAGGPSGQAAGVIISSSPSSGPSRHSPIVISTTPSGYPGTQAQLTVPVIISPDRSTATGYSLYTSTEPPPGTVPVIISPGGTYASGYTGYPGYAGYPGARGSYGYPVQPPGGLLYFHTDQASPSTSYGPGMYTGAPSGYSGYRQQGGILYFHEGSGSSTARAYGSSGYSGSYGSYGNYGGYQTQGSVLTFHQTSGDASTPAWFVVGFEPQGSSLDYTDMVLIQSAANLLADRPGAYAQLVSYSTISSLADKRLQAVAGALIAKGVGSSQLTIYNISGSAGGYTSVRRVEIFVQGGAVESESETEAEHGVKPPTTK